MTKRGKVLIVDDAPANLSFLSAALDQAGYMVLIAMSGQTAIHQVALLKPDIILLDAMMPGLDGYETCSALKRSPHTEDVPVIFMTALDDTDAVVRAFNVGAVDYLTKPVRQAELLARINTHIRQARLIALARQAMDEGGRARIIVDDQGTVLWHTANAAAYLADLRLPDELASSALPHRLMDWFRRSVRSFGDAEEVLDCQLIVGTNRVSLHYQGQVCPGENMLIMERHNEDLSESALRDRFELTHREAQVLLWVTRGKSNVDIATILGMSTRTVSKHLEHVFTKLDVETRTAAAARVIQQCASALF